jgi:hypothetical protein
LHVAHDADEDDDERRQRERYQAGVIGSSRENNARQIARSSATVSGANPILFPRAAAAPPSGPRRKPPRSRVDGQ